jgi:hypothetical protein
MNRQMHRTTLGMLMMAAAASLLVACEMEAPVGEQPGTKPAPTSDESLATDHTSSVTGAGATEPVRSEEDSSLEDLATTARSCRQVISGSALPIFAHPTGGDVSCFFLSGDIFENRGRIGNRFTTWCPRKTPPNQGRAAYAPETGTLPVRCPF